jgi:hypothetical protein
MAADDDVPTQNMSVSPATPAPSAYAPMVISPQQFAFIEKLLDRMDSTRTTFKFELWVYNLSCAAALVLVVFATARSMFEGHAGPAELASYLTSGGLFAITGRRVTRFLDDNIQTIKQVLFSLLTHVQQSPSSNSQEG